MSEKEVTTESALIAIALDCYIDDWFTLDSDAFEHVTCELTHPALMSGTMTALVIAGPLFEDNRQHSEPAVDCNKIVAYGGEPEQEDKSQEQVEFRSLVRQRASDYINGDRGHRWIRDPAVADRRYCACCGLADAPDSASGVCQYLPVSIIHDLLEVLA